MDSFFRYILCILFQIKYGNCQEPLKIDRKIELTSMKGENQAGAIFILCLTL